MQCSYGTEARELVHGKKSRVDVVLTASSCERRSKRGGRVLYPGTHSYDSVTMKRRVITFLIYE